MVERDARRDVIPACERLGIGFLPFYPLLAGLLTGKYRADSTPQGTRLTSGIHFYAGILENADYPLLDRLTDFAAERGHTLIELAIGWLLSQPVIPCVTTGATKVEQIEQNASSSEWRLTPEEMTQVEELLQPSTD